MGSRATVQATAAPGTYKVVGVTAQELDHQASLFFSTAEARRLAGRPGKGGAIGVFPAGADLAGAVAGTGATVHTGTRGARSSFSEPRRPG